jgi:hypothetical protein
MRGEMKKKKKKRKKKNRGVVECTPMTAERDTFQVRGASGQE